MPFQFDQIRNVSFGVSLDSDAGEIHRLVPSETEVQQALVEMLAATMDSLRSDGSAPAEFSPAEKYSSNERLHLPLASELAAKHRGVFQTANFETDAAGLSDTSRLISYFGLFHDALGNRLMAFRKAAQFKGVVRKHLVAFLNDALCMVPDRIFKLDQDFDFVIHDEDIWIWRPTSFIFTSEMDQQIAASAAANVDRVAAQVACADFSGVRDFVAGHKMAMRLVAALKSRNDLHLVSGNRLQALCRDAGVPVTEREGRIAPEAGHEMGFLMVLDRRRYTVTLIDEHPETYEAPSRHLANA